MRCDSPRERTLFLAVALLTALPLALGEYLPFLDLPQHLGLATVIHHLGDPTWSFDAYYFIDPRPLPYWGFYGPVHLLAYLFGVGGAARLVLLLHALAIPFGARSLFRSLGRDPRLGLLAAPLVWNSNLYLGFLSFVVAVPLFLFAVAALERLLAAEEPTRGQWIGATLLGVAVYFAHGQVFLLYLCAAVVLVVLHTFFRETRGSGRWRRGGAVLPALGLGGFWLTSVVAAPASEVSSSEHLKSFSARKLVGSVSWESPGTNLDRLASHLWNINDALLDDLLFGLLFFVLLLGLVVRGLRFAARRRWRADWPGLFALRGELLCGGLLFSYFVTPMEIGMQWYVNPRHLLFAALLGPLMLPPGIFEPVFAAPWPRRLLGGALVPLATGIALGVALHSALTVRAFGKEAAGFEEILAAASPGGRTLGLIYDHGSRGTVQVWPFVHFAGYLQAKGGGDLGFSFAGLPSLPVRYHPGAQAPHPSEWRPTAFRQALHGQHYDRYLLRGRARGDALRLSQGASKVLRSGRWTLIERPRSVTGTAPKKK